MVAPLEERRKRVLGGSVVLHCRQSGEIEELDARSCHVHLEYTADNALQIAFYPSETPEARFVVRIRSGSGLRMIGDEEPSAVPE
jgi:hypothetical protein